MTKQGLLAYVIKGFFLNFCCEEFIQVNYKISKMTEIIGLFEEVLKLSKTVQECEVRSEQLCLSIASLDSSLREEAFKDFYPEEIQQASTYTNGLFVKVFEQNEKRYQPV